MKKINPAIIFFLLCISGPLLIYSIISIFPNTEWHGFGVDSSGRVYIGKQSEILVYSDRECVQEIKIPKYKAYYFTVRDNDTILIASALEVDTYDLTGNLLDTIPDPGLDKYYELKGVLTIQHPSGDAYKVRNVFGFRTITKNSETIVYQTPIGDVLLTVLAILSFITVIALALVLNLHMFTVLKEQDRAVQ